MILTGEQDLFSLLENQISFPDLTCNVTGRLQQCQHGPIVSREQQKLAEKKPIGNLTRNQGCNRVTAQCDMLFTETQCDETSAKQKTKENNIKREQKPPLRM